MAVVAGSEKRGLQEAVALDKHGGARSPASVPTGCHLASPIHYI